MKNEYEKEVEVASAAARQAGELILSKSGKISSGNYRVKGVNDLVTDIDVQAQKIITDILSENFPEYSILAEEDVEDVRSVGPVEGHQWIIDPIDGTTNFMHGAAPFGVSIGLQRGSEMVAGVVLDVPRNELFTAARGNGLYIDGQRARVSTSDKLSDSLMATGFPYRRFEDVDAYLMVLKSIILNSRGVRRPGSASVDLAYIACGRFDGFFESGLSPWDVAAGTLLVREGGGLVTTFGGSEDAVFAQQIVATNGRIHDELLTHLGPIRDSRQ